MHPLSTRGRSPFWNKFLKETDTGLDGDDRINEVIFGLIMVLTFTCTISASAAGKSAIDKMFWSALGCNIAWGIVDGCLYLFSMLYQRGESIDTINRLQKAKNDKEADDALREVMSPLLKTLLKPEQIDEIKKEVQKLPAMPTRAVLIGQDVRNAILIFLLTFFSTFPVTLPFLFLKDVIIAMRISNLIALVLLFTAGYLLGKRISGKPAMIGFGFMVIGSILVGITIALGG